EDRPRTRPISQAICRRSPARSCSSHTPTAGSWSRTPPPATATSKRWATSTPSSPTPTTTLAPPPTTPPPSPIPTTASIPSPVPARSVNLYPRPDPTPPYQGFDDCFANGVNPPTAALLAAVQRPATLNQLFEPSGPPAWQTTPSWSLIGTEDNVIP